MTKGDACKMLKEIFAWPINELNPESGFCPIVVMGHALDGDLDMLSKILGFNAASLGTIVKTIDTQHLARETGHWESRNQAGLSKLVAMTGFAYRDPHTASNDAAMTLICAIQMVLGRLPSSGECKALQQIIDDLELASQQQIWSWDTAEFCLRCGQIVHTKDNHGGGRCRAMVKCVHCSTSMVEKRLRAASSHRIECCIAYVLDFSKAARAGVMNSE